MIERDNKKLDPLTFFGYGFAPGQYEAICHMCGKSFGPTDKKSIHCLPCVEKLIEQSTTRGL